MDVMYQGDSKLQVVDLSKCFWELLQYSTHL